MNLGKNVKSQCPDPHQSDADPDEDLDSTYHPVADSDADPDSDFLYDADADADPDLTFHPDADRDPDPDPSLQLKAQTVEKVLK